ncbi:putative adenine-specific methylase [Planctomycetales bacterium]|nr:putative adenine-specific methylase [Planctomycetales bacterium]
MPKSTRNADLHAAKKEKNDEFYTQFADIDNECIHYRQQFKGKIILCNCDDPRVSNFFYYFYANFCQLGLKKLIAVCYKNLNPDLFSQHKDEKAVYCIYDGKGRTDDIIDDNKEFFRRNEWGVLKGDGDFRTEECIELLKQADIVVTNPPFSLFREFVAQLIEYDKKFLIIGNVNALSYKELFPLIKENKIWLGISIHSGDREFGVPDSYPLNAAGYRVDEKGNKYIRVKGVRWFTNLDHKIRHEIMPLYARYAPNEYPKYDNYDAIEVSKTADIPCDYAGAMGVPLTFLDKYNPEQFEILGSDYDVKQGLLPELVNPNWTGKLDRGYISGERLYARVLIRHKKENK